MRQQTWGQRLGTGGLAGLAGGVVSAVLFWLLVEPSISRAIVLEESGSADAGAHVHSHGAASGSSHDHAELVTRSQQQVGGTLTVIIVAVLFGLAFSVVYVKSRPHLPGRTELGRSASMAALAFGAAALMPALVTPANLPGVGDPSTVNQRALTYLITILVSVLAFGLVFALKKMLDARLIPEEWRWLTIAAAALGAITVVLLAIPRVAQDIPATVPADLIWEFRLGSLAQLLGMWATIGVIHGFRCHRSSGIGPARVARREIPV